MSRFWRPVLVVALMLGCRCAASAPEKADLVKASMVEKIARFIDWPQSAATAFTLCLAQEHPQLQAVQAYYDKSVTVGERPVVVQILKRQDPFAGCQVIFLATRDLGDLARYRTFAAKDHVLLIAEGADVAKDGVHVAFYSDMGRLRLEVNRKALEASGLKASFRLLEAAKIVE